MFIFCMILPSFCCGIDQAFSVFLFFLQLTRWTGPDQSLRVKGNSQDACGRCPFIFQVQFFYRKKIKLSPVSYISFLHYFFPSFLPVSSSFFFSQGNVKHNRLKSIRRWAVGCLHFFNFSFSFRKESIMKYTSLSLRGCLQFSCKQLQKMQHSGGSITRGVSVPCVPEAFCTINPTFLFFVRLFFRDHNFSWVCFFSFCFALSPPTALLLFAWEQQGRDYHTPLSTPSSVRCQKLYF